MCVPRLFSRMCKSNFHHARQFQVLYSLRIEKNFAQHTWLEIVGGFYPTCEIFTYKDPIFRFGLPCNIPQSRWTFAGRLPGSPWEGKLKDKQIMWSAAGDFSTHRARSFKKLDHFQSAHKGPAQNIWRVSGLFERFPSFGSLHWFRRWRDSETEKYSFSSSKFFPHAIFPGLFVVLNPVPRA